MVSNKIVVRRSSEVEDKKIDDSMILKRLTNVEHSPQVDFVTAFINGEHGYRKNAKSTKIFFVLEGELIISDENDRFVLGKGDLALLNPSVGASITGVNASVVMVVGPAFNPDDEI